MTPGASQAKGRFGNPKAEAMRLRALYRAAVLRGDLRIGGEGALRSMRRLVGPDCAYHLYRGIPARGGRYVRFR